MSPLYPAGTLSYSASRRSLRGVAFIPTSAPNLEYWFKADSLALSDGAAVATWADSSGNTRDISQGTGANQPVYKTGILNGQPVVRFDGSNDTLARAPEAANKSAAFSMFVVVVPRALGNFGAMASAAGSWVFYKWNDQNIRLSAGTALTTTSAAVIGTPMVYGLTLVTGSRNIYANGASIGSDSGAFTANSTGSLVIGADAAAGTFFYNGDVAEFLYYSRVVDSTERSSVTSYLGSKYGITVA